MVECFKLKMLSNWLRSSKNPPNEPLRSFARFLSSRFGSQSKEVCSQSHVGSLRVSMVSLQEYALVLIFLEAVGGLLSE